MRLPDSVIELLVAATINLFGVATLFALAIGLLLLVRPGWVMWLRQRLDRRYSLRPLGKPVEKPIPTERFIYRHHRGFGLFITLGSGYALYQLITRGGAAIALLVADSGELAGYHRWLLESSGWFLLIGNLFGLIVGVITTLRPSLLKGIEGWGNRWLSTRTPLRPVDVDHMALDRWLVGRPRLIGMVVIIGAGYILINLWFYFRFDL